MSDMNQNPASISTVDSSSLRSHVNVALQRYLSQLDGAAPSNLYELVLEEVEPALFESVLRHTHGNKVVASEMLGISRTTLHSRLKRYFGSSRVFKDKKD